jgi:hypothetical protein
MRSSWLEERNLPHQASIRNIPSRSSFEIPPELLHLNHHFRYSPESREQRGLLGLEVPLFVPERRVECSFKFRWLPQGAALKNNSQAAEGTMNALVDLVIYIVLIVLLCGLSIWLLDQLGSTISEPLYRVTRIAIIVVAISLIISVLLWAAASQIG